MTDVPSPFKTPARARAGVLLDRIAAMGDQLPPRLKALLNLAISIVLVVVAVPVLWRGVSETSLPDISLGVGLALLGVFNLFT